jgi:hypothetical protein
LELLLPGNAPLPLWRPDEVVVDPTTVAVRFMTGGVAKKP